MKMSDSWLVSDSRSKVNMEQVFLHGNQYTESSSVPRLTVHSGMSVEELQTITEIRLQGGSVIYELEISPEEALQRVRMRPKYQQNSGLLNNLVPVASSKPKHMLNGNGDVPMWNSSEDMVDLSNGMNNNNNQPFLNPASRKKDNSMEGKFNDCDAQMIGNSSSECEDPNAMQCTFGRIPSLSGLSLSSSVAAFSSPLSTPAISAATATAASSSASSSSSSSSASSSSLSSHSSSPQSSSMSVTKMVEYDALHPSDLLPPLAPYPSCSHAQPGVLLQQQPHHLPLHPQGGVDRPSTRSISSFLSPVQALLSHPPQIPPQLPLQPCDSSINTLFPSQTHPLLDSMSSDSINAPFQSQSFSDSPLLPNHNLHSFSSPNCAKLEPMGSEKSSVFGDHIMAFREAVDDNSLHMFNHNYSNSHGLNEKIYDVYGGGDHDAFKSSSSSSSISAHSGVDYRPSGSYNRFSKEVQPIGMHLSPFLSPNREMYEKPLVNSLPSARSHSHSPDLSVWRQAAPSHVRYNQYPVDTQSSRLLPQSLVCTISNSTSSSPGYTR